MILELVVGCILSIANFFGEQITKKIHPHVRSKMISFGAGIAITYLFLQLFPELYDGVRVINKVMYVYVLLGFTAFHILEKHIYQHLDRERLHRELKEAHSLALFIYHFVLGIIVVRLFADHFLEGLLFILPLTFHTIVSGISMEDIHYGIKEKKILRILLSSAPLAGVLFALLLHVSAIIFYMLLGFVVGAMLYVTIRDILPKERKGHVEYFLSGSFLYALLIILLWMYVPA